MADDADDVLSGPSTADVNRILAEQEPPQRGLLGSILDRMTRGSPSLDARSYDRQYQQQNNIAVPPELDAQMHPPRVRFADIPGTPKQQAARQEVSDFLGPLMDDPKTQLLMGFAGPRAGVGMPRVQRSWIERAAETMPIERDPRGFWSRALEAAKRMQRQHEGPAQGYRNALTREGVGNAEMRGLGIDKFLADNPRVTRQQLEDYIRANRPQLKEWSDTGDTAWRRYSIDNAQGQRNRLAHTERVLGMDAPKADLILGEPEPFGANYGDLSGKALWGGNRELPVEGVTVTPFKIGNQEGRITYWPETYDTRMMLGDWVTRPEGPRYEVSAPNFQSGRFRTLEGARNAVLDAYNNQPNSSMFRARRDVGTDAHYGDAREAVPDYLLHTRSHPIVDERGSQGVNWQEIQSTRAQQLRDEGAFDQEKFAKAGQAANAAREARDAAKTKIEAMMKKANFRPSDDGIMFVAKAPYEGDVPGLRDAARDYLAKKTEWSRLHAEAEAMERAPAPHRMLEGNHWIKQAMSDQLMHDLRANPNLPFVTLPSGELVNSTFFKGSGRMQTLQYDPRQKLLSYTPVGEKVPRKSGSLYHRDQIEPSDLPDLIGKETARRLLAQPKLDHYPPHLMDAARYGSHRLVADPGEHFFMGNHGLRDAYNEMYPAMLEGLLRSVDPNFPGARQTRVQDPTFSVSPRRKSAIKPSETLHHEPFRQFPLTDQIRSHIEKYGLPYWRFGGMVKPYGGS